MLEVLSRVVDSVRNDISQDDLDKSVESIFLKLTRKPSRRDPQPQPSNLWQKRFIRRTRRPKQSRSKSLRSQTKTKSTITPLSTAADMRKNKLKRRVGILQAKQQEHVKSLEDLGSAPCNTDEDGVNDHDNKCSICLHSTKNQKGSNVAMLDCFHEFCRPCIELWFAVDREQSCPRCRNPTSRYMCGDLHCVLPPKRQITCRLVHPKDPIKTKATSVQNPCFETTLQDAIEKLSPNDVCIFLQKSGIDITGLLGLCLLACDYHNANNIVCCVFTDRKCYI